MRSINTEIQSVILAALISLGSVYYLINVFFTSPEPTDLKYFWIAGKIWLNGGNVYDESFEGAALAIAATTEQIENGQHFTAFLYAPHIWIISALLGQFDYDTARVILGVIHILCVIVGTLLATQSAAQNRSYLFFSVLLALASTTIGTVMSVSMAQFGTIIYLGVAAFIFGICKKSEAALVFGLVILTMKPNIGLPFVFFALAFNNSTRSMVLLAGLISLGFSLPAIVHHSLIATIGGYIGGLSAYSSLGPNSAQSTTGLGNILNSVFGWSPSGVILTGISVIGSSVLSWVSHNKIQSGVADRQSSMAILLSIFVFFVPLHLYDLTIFVIFIALSSNVVEYLITAGSNVFVFRVHRFTEVIGVNLDVVSFRGSFIASLVAAVVMLYSLYTLFLWFKQRPSGKH